LPTDELENYHEVKVRVDDDVSLMIDCEERLNTHKVPGWQWQEVMTATFTAKNKMLAMHAYNQVRRELECVEGDWEMVAVSGIIVLGILGIAAVRRKLEGVGKWGWEVEYVVLGY
jgi:hypothetical protein